jgi:hypothetical protein
LTNDGERNDQRRKDLDGLLAWLLAVGIVAVRVAARSSGIPHPWATRMGRGLMLFHLGLNGLLFLPLLPRAYAVGEWGLRYPTVRLAEGNPDCQPALARALDNGTCCAIDVSEGATEKYLYVNGVNCPYGPIVSLQTKSTRGGECIETRSTGVVPERVIHNGC